MRPRVRTASDTTRIFFVPGLKKTFAELLPEEKNAISHRGNALAIFKDKLAEYRRDHQL